MKLAIFGLSISSSWGNGHATLWRGLVAGLARHGCSVIFFERDTPYYATNRDLFELPDGELVLYEGWAAIRARARRAMAEADAVIVTSYCPDALAAGAELLNCDRPLRVFYDLDTPVTLSRLERGEEVSYIGETGLRDFELVLSFTGGEALDHLRRRLGARQVAPLYGHVDVRSYGPAPPIPQYRADLSYIGTYAEDRQQRLQDLLVEPARLAPELTFVIAGAQYPRDFPWQPNIRFVRHLAPPEHPSFYASSRLTLNITRQAMARMGWCPSGRLFEAAACGCPLLSDDWQGIGDFYEPDREILLAHSTADVLEALARPGGELARIGVAARERTLACHTSDKRAGELLALLQGTRTSGAQRAEGQNA
jgi:spore maturation protein CgeB